MPPCRVTSIEETLCKACFWRELTLISSLGRQFRFDGRQPVTALAFSSSSRYLCSTSATDVKVSTNVPFAQELNN